MSLAKEVEDTLAGEEAVWVLLLTDALHEDGEVVMVVELFHLNLPLDFVGRAVLNLDGQISAVVETTELGALDLSLLDGTGSRSLNLRLFLGLVQRGWVATASLTTLHVS